jgi:hypothetical protein
MTIAILWTVFGVITGLGGIALIAAIVAMARSGYDNH